MEDLFKIVKDYGFLVRKNRLNGLRSWNEIKSLVQNGEDSRCNWNFSKEQLEEMYFHVHDSLNMRGEEMDSGYKEEDENHEDWEKMHFFLQLVRIPKNNDCKLLRVCQIGYNLGQLSAEKGDTIYTSEVEEYYNANRLEELGTYIDVECFNNVYGEEIGRIILNMGIIISNVRSLIEQRGGNKKYYEKYIKYKNKYLRFKKEIGNSTG
jgi:hypothetical protein